MEAICTPLAWLFGKILFGLYSILGSYGFAIIIIAILLRIAMLPLTIKQQKTMKKQREIQGETKAIQEKYKNDPETMNREIMALYKRTGTSPFSGCLSSILQIFIILAMFFVVSKPLTYMLSLDNDKINEYAGQLGDNAKTAYQQIAIVDYLNNSDNEEDKKNSINMDFFGLNLSNVPNQHMQDWKVYIIPVLYIITSVISIQVTTRQQNKMLYGDKKKEKAKKADFVDKENSKPVEEKAEDSENKDGKDKKSEKKKEEDSGELMDASMQSMSKTMMYMMPIISVSIAFVAPLGLALYWLVSNIMMIVERFIIKKFTDK